MKNLIKFQSAGAEDTQWIYTSLRQMALENEVLDRFSLTLKKLEEMLFKNPIQAEVLMAYLNEQAVGFALFSVTNRNFNLFPSPGFYLHNFYVAPEFRRKKIGTRLLNQLENEARDRGYCRIDWVLLNNNSEGDEFFKSYKGAEEVDYISYQRISL